MAELLQNFSLFPLVLTLGSYQIGLWCQKKTKSAICNPLLIAALICIGALLLIGMDPQAYASGTAGISWLLTPATVSLAVGMYEQFQILRKHTAVLVAGVAAGAVSCLAMVLILGLLFGFAPEITASLLPKSVTTAIGIPLAEMAGGMTPIATAAIILTGITASVLGPVLCKLFRLTDEVAQGAAFGTAGHVIGTSKAMEQSELAGAVSSFSLVIAGLMTAIVLPLVTAFL
jgi:putative effector of murein hydrolase